MSQLVDLLQPRRASNDAFWLTFHNYACNHYKRSPKRSPAQIRADVYKEPLIQELLQKDPRAKAEIEKILDEMCHTYTLKSVRFIGYFVLKIMKSIYRHVWIEDNLCVARSSFYYDATATSLSTALNGIITQAPILYLPTHRSYADFLLLSYVCFQMKLPLPAIAAGIDFLSLNQIASLLRSCGAFFIRRSFRDSGDLIYRRIFRAYVQDLVRGGEMPLECFIEGTRSRSGKSLQPKIGLFGTALQLYWTSQIPDLVLMPISICYDRILEEDLYAKELSPPQIDVSSGSKPKETPQHLLNGAKAILSQDFGSVYLRFGEPISLREVEGSQHVRQQYTKFSKLADGPQCREEIVFADQLARRVMFEHHRASVISSFSLFSLMAFSDLIERCNYLEYEPMDIDHFDYPVKNIVETMEQLGNLISPKNLSHQIFQRSLEEDLMQSLSVHHNLVTVLNGETIRIPLDSHLVLARLRNYANQFLQMVVGVAMVTYSPSFEAFLKLENILSQEFVFNPKAEINYESEKTSSNSLSSRLVNIFTSQMEYFLINYQRLAGWLLLIEPNESYDSRAFMRKAQSELKIPMDMVQNFIQLSTKHNSIQKQGKLLVVDVSAARALLDLITSLCNKDETLPTFSEIKPKL